MKHGGTWREMRRQQTREIGRWRGNWVDRSQPPEKDRPDLSSPAGSNLTGPGGRQQTPDPRRVG